MAAEYTVATGTAVSRTAIIKHFSRIGVPRDPSQADRPKEVVAANEVIDSPEAGFVYVIGMQAPRSYFKIGMAKHFPARLEAHQCASPFDLFVACAYFAPDMRAEERRLHHKFSASRVRGEWFELTGADLKAIAERALLIDAAE